MSQLRRNVNSMAQASAPPGAEFSYEVAEKALEDQLRRIDAQDGKAGVLIAAAGVFGGFVFSSDSFLSAGPSWVIAATGGLVTAAILSALLASLNQRYVMAPRPAAVATFARRDEAWLKWRFLSNVHGALEWNHRKLDRKTRLLTFAQGLFMLAAVLVGAYFVVSAI